MRLHKRLEILEVRRKAVDDRRAQEASHEETQLLLGETRAIEIAIAYDRRVREDAGGWKLPWNGPEDLRGLGLPELARLYNERLAFLRAAKAAGAGTP